MNAPFDAPPHESDDLQGCLPDNFPDDPPPKPHAAPGFAFVRASDLEFHEPEYLVQGLIETDAFAMLFGDRAAGKSFVVLDLVASIATGTDFHGRKTKRGTVIYIAGEGHNGLARRLTAWERARGVSLDRAPLFVSRRAAAMLDGASAQAVALAVDTIARDEGMPAVIVVDTVARNFGAGDENAPQDMNTFISAMDDLRTRYPVCTVLLVHHSGHGDKSRGRGSSHLPAALDTEFRVERSDKTVTVENTKMKDGPTPPPLVFRLDDVRIGTAKNGDPITSCALSLTDAQPAQKRERLTGVALIGMDSFLLAKQRAGAANDLGAAVHLEEWRTVFYERHTADTVNAKRVAFQRAREALVTGGHMTATDDMYRLARIPEGRG